MKRDRSLTYLSTEDRRSWKRDQKKLEKRSHSKRDLAKTPKYKEIYEERELQKSTTCALTNLSAEGKVRS